MCKRIFQPILGILTSMIMVIAMAMIVFTPTVAMAIPGDNQGTGDIAGIAGDLTDSNVFNLTSSTLVMVKTAFTDAGVELTSGDTVPGGTTVKFVIYVDNTTDSPANDVRMEDLLNDTDFTYVTGSLSWNNLATATGATTATIYSNTDLGGSGVVLTDLVSAADEASANDTVSPDSITMGAHATQTNAALNIPANMIAAFMFRAIVN